MDMAKKIIFILLIFLFSACTPSTKTSTMFPTQEIQGTDYPVTTEPEGEPIPPYPVEEETETVSSYDQIPTPDSALGQVKGTFIIEGKPMTMYRIYLAKVLADSEGLEIVVGFERSESYPAYVDEEGNFYFANVLPGRYGLILDQVTRSFLMTWPGKEDSLIITVDANKVLDLGVLEYETPPTN